MKFFVVFFGVFAALVTSAVRAEEKRYDVRVGQDTPVEVAMIDFTAFAPGADIDDFYEVNDHLEGVDVIPEGEIYYVVDTHRFLNDEPSRDEERHEIKVGGDMPVEAALETFIAFAPGADLEDFYEVNDHLDEADTIKSGEVYYFVVTDRFRADLE